MKPIICEIAVASAKDARDAFEQAKKLPAYTQIMREHPAPAWERRHVGTSFEPKAGFWMARFEVKRRVPTPAQLRELGAALEKRSQHLFADQVLAAAGELERLAQRVATLEAEFAMATESACPSCVAGGR